MEENIVGWMPEARVRVRIEIADSSLVRDRRRKAMTQGIASLLFAILLAGALPTRALAAPVARPLSFASVAQTALQDNLQLRAAAFDVAVAQAQLAQARGAKLPQANLYGSYTRNQEQPLLADPNVYAASLVVSYPLSTGGNLEARIRLAEANVRGAQATYERTKQQIVFAAEQTYLQALLAAESVAAAQRSLAVANESLRVAQVRFSAGAGARLDVLQAEVAVASAEQALVQAQTGVGNAQANLNALINLPLDTPLALTDTLTPRPVDIALADAIARALRERADLAALRNRIEAAQAGIDVAQSGGAPTFGFGAGYALSNANGLSTTIFGGWLVTLGVTLSVFDGGITQAQIREAQLQLEQLKLREAQIRQQVELDVRVAALALQRAAGELTAATKAVEQGRESVRLATVRYQSGVGTSLELLTAQSNLALAEQSLASARFNQNAARIQLILAMGSQ